jgi:hypothetical protein
MSDTESKEYQRRLWALIHQQQVARGVAKDRWNLKPVRKGWRRGMVTKLRHSEEPCEFGMLLIMDFELSEDPEQPGIPVRMSGTQFSDALFEGTVVEIADPTPDQRPIIATQVRFSHYAGDATLRAHYPGRGEMPAGRRTLLGLLALGWPAVALVAALTVLHFWWHVF